MNSADLAQVGVVGMAVMGSNLARNFASKGFRVALYNRTWARTQEVIDQHGSEGDFRASEKLEDFVASLERPRRIIIMVKAGAGTDAVIQQLTPLLEEGDIIVDGGNADFHDTRRREHELAEHKLHFVGAGISGGEEGALNGPSIMPGGPKDFYPVLGPMLEKISAHYEGEPCCTYIGPDGAGHFVKMVHNGIEYADMQFIAEAYDVLKAAGLSTAEISDAFRQWNTGDLDSFLIEITSIVLDQTDPRTGQPLVDIIVDQAEQKGTGRWTVQNALELGVPVNTIAEAVFARSTSGHEALRKAGQAALQGPDRSIAVEDRQQLLSDVRDALWAAKVVAYAQGLDEIRTGSDEFDWNIDISAVVKIWRAGCIIRAKLLDRISNEYAAQNLATLLEAPSVAADLDSAQTGWRRVIGLATAAGVPVPGFSAALAYYDSARDPRLPAALVQGLRDYFGAHTYRRVDDAGSYHIEWSGDRSETRTDA
nr:NADP-dependent phosphogluconate dehydrogenase [Granulicoccus phenolivorans]